MTCRFEDAFRFKFHYVLVALAIAFVPAIPAPCGKPRSWFMNANRPCCSFHEAYFFSCSNLRTTYDVSCLLLDLGSSFRPYTRGPTSTQKDIMHCVRCSKYYFLCHADVLFSPAASTLTAPCVRRQARSTGSSTCIRLIIWGTSAGGNLRLSTYTENPQLPCVQLSAGVVVSVHARYPISATGGRLEIQPIPVADEVADKVSHIVCRRLATPGPGKKLLACFRDSVFSLNGVKVECIAGMPPASRRALLPLVGLSSALCWRLGPSSVRKSRHRLSRNNYEVRFRSRHAGVGLESVFHYIASAHCLRWQVRSTFELPSSSGYPSRSVP